MTQEYSNSTVQQPPLIDSTVQQPQHPQQQIFNPTMQQQPQQQIFNPAMQQQPQQQVINPTMQQPQVINVQMTSDKSKITALLLCLFLGVFGGHLFYVGRIGKGILYVCTFGLLFIGPLIDTIYILTGGFKDNVGAPLRNN